MSRLYSILLPVIFGAFLAFTAGCATTAPTKFYILNALEGAAPAEAVAPGEMPPAIGLGPMSLPDYLKRPHIVTRGEGNEIRFAEFDRWAEPLKKNLYRVFTENLSNILKTDHVYAYPWKRGSVMDYQVEIEILSFEVSSGGEAELVSRWTVYGSAGGGNGGDGGRTELISKRSSFKEAAGGDGYRASVTALNKTLDSFSREMASAIDVLEESKAKP